MYVRQNTRPHQTLRWFCFQSALRSACLVMSSDDTINRYLYSIHSHPHPKMLVFSNLELQLILGSRDIASEMFKN